MATATASSVDRIVELLGAEAESLMSFQCKGITKDRLMVPGPDHVEQAFGASDRKPAVLVNLQRLYGTGRLAGSGYLSILPVDQGVEHSGAASFAPNPDYFDPAKIVELAIAAQCNGVAPCWLVASTGRPAAAMSRAAGIAVHEFSLTKHDVYVADECFLTGTAAEVIAVVKVDSREIGSGKPGPMTHDLEQRFKDLTKK